MILGGDYGYDLDSNGGKKYELYLDILSQVSRFVPVIHVTGNHEYNRPEIMKLFAESFELYNLEKDLAIGLRLGSFYLASFDPYEVLYKSAGNLKADSPKSLIALKRVIEIGVKEYNMVISNSHYPLICSGTSSNCKKDTTDLKEYFDLMMSNHIPFYIGAHYHTYERVYPYLSNGTISLGKKSPYFYNSSEPSLISIL